MAVPAAHPFASLVPMKLAAIGLALGFALGPLVACGNSDDDDGPGADGGAPDASFDASIDHAAPADASRATDSGGDADADTGSVADAADTGTPAHTTGHTMTVQGVARTYDLTVPLDCATTRTKVPLVIVLHGDDEQGADPYRTFGLEQAATAAGAGAVFVYPDGTDDVGVSHNAWNLYDDPGVYPYAPATPSGNDDVDYFDQMVTTFEQLPCVEPRVFVTGISSGGYMANQLARWRSSVVTGVAPMSGEPPSGTEGTDYPDCVGTTGPVPAFIIHGAADTVLPPGNGQQTVSYWDMANTCAQAAADCAFDADAGSDDLAVPPATPTTAAALAPCVTSNGCTGAPVTFCLVDGLSHAVWSEAGTAVWSFIAATKPDAGT